MIKTPATKILCMLLTLAFLLTPVAAMADGEETTDTDIRIGNQPKCYAIVKKGDLDTSGELFINGISYEAQLNPKGDIVVRTVDLTAAKRAAEAIADYEASHPGKSFEKTDSMKIISGYGLKLTRSELPDLTIAARELGTMEFPEELRDDSTQRLGQALTGLEQTLSEKSDQNYSDKIQSVMQRFSVSDARFNEKMKDVYLLLYEIRAAIACGTLPQSILTEETTTNLLTIFRDILKKGGLDLDEIEFWENDEAWATYAAKESKVKIVAGDRIAISDKTGKDVPVTVIGVWSAPVVPEPPPPDEYVYEPPMPPVSPPEVPM